MSMYSELLAASLGSDGEPPVGPGAEVELVHERVECRHRLARGVPVGVGSRGASNADVIGDLAAQIDYDLTLVRLCRLHGVECDPARFTRPLPERQRLEAMLRGMGVDLGPDADA